MKKTFILSAQLAFKNGTKSDPPSLKLRRINRKLIAGECLPIENRLDLSKDLEITFWTVLDIG